MSENLDTLDAFVANITRTLTQHGYPERRVALPLERMYEVAYAKGLNFNKALELLAERGVVHEKTSAKIIFFAKAEPTEADPEAASTMPDFTAMMAQAQEMLRTMSPEQLQSLQNTIANISEDEKLEMLRKARGMGL